MEDNNFLIIPFILIVLMILLSILNIVNNNYCGEDFCNRLEIGIEDHKVSDVQTVQPTIIEPIKEPIIEPVSAFNWVSIENYYYTKEQKEDLFKQVGIMPNDYKYADYIIFAESSWDYTTNNAETGAYGFCGINPNWYKNTPNQEDEVMQMAWCNSYANWRYGSWENAYYFHLENGWW